MIHATSRRVIHKLTILEIQYSKSTEVYLGRVGK